MPIQVRCSCGKTYNVADRLAGKKFKCQGCDKALAIRRPAPQAKVSTADTGGEDGFLEMDLDSEFSQMAEIERPAAPEPEYLQSQFADPRERRDPRVANMSLTDDQLAATLIPGPTRAERTGKFFLGLTGVAVGIGAVIVGMTLWAQQGIRIRGLVVLGIFLLIGGAKALAGED